MRFRPIAHVLAGVILSTAGTAHAQPSNDSCTTAEAIAGFTTVTWDSSAATTDGLSNAGCNFFGQPQMFNDIWYCWTAPSAGPVQITTCGQTSLDTKLAVYGGCGCPEGDGLIICNDDASGCGAQTSVRFTAAAGASYLVRLGSYNTNDFGLGTFTVAAYVPTTLAGPITNAANSHTYFLLPASSWSAARTDALALGGDLVTLNDADENEWVRVNVLGFDGTDRRGWIGFNDTANEGTFAWSSGQTSSYTNWNGGEPNDAGGNEDFAEMFGSGTGLWNDQPNAPALTIFGLVEIEPPPACPADFNGIGGVTVQDIFDFLAAYFTNNPSADINGQGGVTVQDIFDFLSFYFAGC